MKAGTVFIGNVNKHKFQIVKTKGDTATIKDLTTGKTISYGVKALKHCDISILERGK